MAHQRAALSLAAEWQSDVLIPQDPAQRSEPPSHRAPGNNSSHGDAGLAAWEAIQDLLSNPKLHTRGQMPRRSELYGEDG